MGTTFYPHLASPAPSQDPPVTSGGLPLNSNPPTYLLDITAPIGPQQSRALAYSLTASNLIYTALFCTAPLLAQTIPSCTWTLGYAWANTVGSPTTGGTFPGQYGNEGVLYLVNGATGAIKSQICVLSGAVATGSAGEQTVYGNATGNSVAVAQGDFLSLGVLLNNQTNGGTVSGTFTIYTDGTTPISSSGVGTTNALSSLTCSVNLVLPIPGQFSCVGGARMSVTGAAIPPHYNGPIWS